MDTLNLDDQTNVSNYLTQLTGDLKNNQSFPENITVNTITVKEFYTSESQASINNMDNSQIIFYNGNVSSMSLGNYIPLEKNINSYPSILLYDTYSTASYPLLDISIQPNATGPDAAYIAFKTVESQQSVEYARIQLDQNNNIIFSGQQNVNISSSGSNTISLYPNTVGQTQTIMGLQSNLSTQPSFNCDTIPIVLNGKKTGSNYTAFNIRNNKSSVIPDLSMSQFGVVSNLDHLATNVPTVSEQIGGSLPSNISLLSQTSLTTSLNSTPFNLFQSTIDASGNLNLSTNLPNLLTKSITNPNFVNSIQTITDTVNSLVTKVYNGVTQNSNMIAGSSNQPGTNTFNFALSPSASNSSYTSIQNGGIDMGVSGTSQFSISNDLANSNYTNLLFQSNPMITFTNQNINNANTVVVQYLNLPNASSIATGISKTVVVNNNPGEYVIAYDTNVASKGNFKIQNGKIEIGKNRNTENICIVNENPLTIKIKTAQNIDCYFPKIQILNLEGDEYKINLLNSIEFPTNEFIFEVIKNGNHIFQIKETLIFNYNIK